MDSKHKDLSLDFHNACKSTQLPKMGVTHIPNSEEMIRDIMYYSYNRMPDENLKLSFPHLADNMKSFML